MATSHLKRLNFGPYTVIGGLNFQEYVLNALSQIEKWSHEVNQVVGEAGTEATTSSLTDESGDYLLKESGTGLGLES